MNRLHLLAYATFIVFLGLMTAASTASAKVPTAKDVLRKTHVWASQLPPQSVMYRLVITHPKRSVEGTAVLNAGRVLLSKLAGLSDSPTAVLWGAILRSEGARALRKAGVNTAVTSLFHRNRRIVVIVGSKPGQTKKSQVWFDRTTGAPVYFHLHGAGEAHTLSFGDYDSPGSGPGFPGSFLWSDATRRVRATYLSNQ